MGESATGLSSGHKSVFCGGLRARFLEPNNIFVPVLHSIDHFLTPLPRTILFSPVFGIWKWIWRGSAGLSGLGCTEHPLALRNASARAKSKARADLLLLTWLVFFPILFYETPVSITMEKAPCVNSPSLKSSPPTHANG